jgi:hypothetical protein
MINEGLVLQIDVHKLTEHTKTSKSNPKNSLFEC